MTTTQQLPLFSTLEEQDDEGRFPCPRCKTIIDPGDFTNTAYEIVEAVVNKRGTLENVRVKCLVCKSQIVIVLK